MISHEASKQPLRGSESPVRFLTLRECLQRWLFLSYENGSRVRSRSVAVYGTTSQGNKQTYRAPGELSGPKARAGIGSLENYVEHWNLNSRPIQYIG